MLEDSARLGDRSNERWNDEFASGVSLAIAMKVPRALQPIAILLTVLASHTVHADAKTDIQDLRAGKLPVRHEMLGWATFDEAVLRTLVCVESGTTNCRVAIEHAAPSAQKTTTLLDLSELYCNPKEWCAPLTRRVVSDFALAETREIAALGPLMPGSTIADPSAVLGTVAGSPTTVGFRTLAVNDTKRGPGVRLDLVLRGARGSVETLANLHDFDVLD